MAGIFHLLLGRVQQAVASAVDPFFNYVTALLHGDGTNGAQNNTFLDSSTNNFTITRNGNTTQGTFSPFSQTGWGNYFNGSTDYLSVGSNASLNASNGDFTVECWVYTTARNTNSCSLFSLRNADDSSFADPGINNDGKLQCWNVGGAFGSASTASVPLNQWTHVAFVRSSNVLYYYINGTQSGSTTMTNTWSGTTPKIGGQNWNAAFMYNGYISNIRYTKSAVYTSSFTPSTTPLTAITNTQLLTCQSNRFLDNSANAFAITVNGSPSVQAFSPFNPTSAWSASSNGGSGYFDGSGDYLTLSQSIAMSLGTGDFTVEAWVYPTANPAIFWTIIDARGAALNIPWAAGMRVVSGSLKIEFFNGTSIQGTTPVPLNTWTHVAFSRSGTTLRGFMNGALDINTTMSTNLTAGISQWIGALIDPSYTQGYLADVRVVKGTAVYTAAFTPPTAPLTAITNTQLLLNYTNAGIYDNAAVGDYETVGNAQVSTAVVKYGTGSMSFNGTNSYLVSADKEAYNFGSGDFTAEAWVYPTSFANEPMIMGQWSGDLGGTGLSWALMFSAGSTGYIRLITSSTGAAVLFDLSSSPYALSLNTWYHIAAVRIGSTFKVYVNGNQVATTTNTSALYNATNVFTIGVESNSPTQYFSGYIDDIRLTKGYGRYPYNFTPPAAAFPNIGGTVTLTADPYFNYTTLLLPGNGTNGAQNNTFLDSSSNAFTITRNGNTTQGNFSPFSQTGWGNYFSGSSQYLSVTGGVTNAGTGDFTLEFWAYYTGDYSNYGFAFDSRTSGGGFTDGFNVAVNITNGYWYAGFTAQDLLTSIPAAKNQWTHIAVSRSGTTMRLFVNGTLGGSVTTSNNLTSTTNYIGTYYSANNYYFPGYISNLRAVKSGALYTANFTPPTTPLTTTVSAGTVSLLTCQSNRFVDNSANAFAITVNGSPSVQAFSPFAPTAAWSASTNGGSGYFDGSGDSLQAANNVALRFGTGDFTAEAWVYFTALPSGTNVAQIVGTQWSGSTPTGAYTLWLRGTSNKIEFAVWNSILLTSTSALTANQWYHVAVTRSGTSTKLFINGNNEATATSSFDYNNTTYPTIIGRYDDTAGGLTYLTGYIGDLRLVKGTAVYTAAFTPPTAPLTAISGTSLLLNYTNGGITDATAKNDLETVGNAQISTTQSKFGGSSMYFDGGASTRLYGSSNPNLSLGSADFTMEMWMYHGTGAYVNAQPVLLQNWSTTWAANYWSLHADHNSSTAGKFTFWVYNNSSTVPLLISTSTSKTSTWNHIAITRYGNTFAMFVNGIKEVTGTFSGSMDGGGSWPIYVGGPNQAYDGYIDDLRITKGIARYTSNFTPPTSAFLLQ